MDEILYERECKLCGTKFFVNYAGKATQYCSDPCKHIAKNEARKRYRLRGNNKQRALDVIPGDVEVKVEKIPFTRDYARLQMQQTLAMIGRVE